jgi:archaeosortase A (PGF-CTERM-specific)
MMVPPLDVLLDTLVVGAALSMVLALVGYRTGRQRLGREGAIVGFGLLAVVLTVLSVRYTTVNRTDWLFLVTTTAGGALLSAHAIRLVMGGWDRTGQLVTMTAVMLVIALPFELAPVLRVFVQEQLARQVLAVAEPLGYDVAIQPAGDGQMTRLVTDSDAHIRIARECSGIEGVALFGGILAGVRTTLRRRLAGVAFMLGAVYVVNMLRMLFVVAALSGNWFGPLLTDGNTVQMTYYVAEVGIGQSFVVFASVAGYLWVSRWIPDGLDFATDLLDTVETPRLP